MDLPEIIDDSGSQGKDCRFSLRTRLNGGEKIGNDYHI
jgi:hypothetical protein